MGRKETVELTNMCMVEDGKGNVLVQNRLDPNWSGIVYPGGHVEAGVAEEHERRQEHADADEGHEEARRGAAAEEPEAGRRRGRRRRGRQARPRAAGRV